MLLDALIVVGRRLCQGCVSGDQSCWAESKLEQNMPWPFISVAYIDGLKERSTSGYFHGQKFRIRSSVPKTTVLHIAVYG